MSVATTKKVLPKFNLTLQQVYSRMVLKKKYIDENTSTCTTARHTGYIVYTSPTS